MPRSRTCSGPVLLTDASALVVLDLPVAVPIRTSRPLTGTETLAGYAVNAARAGGISDVAGMLRPGYRAHFVAWAEDPSQCPPAAVAQFPGCVSVPRQGQPIRELGAEDVLGGDCQGAVVGVLDGVACTNRVPQVLRIRPEDRGLAR